jgi:hypothetical protein
MDKSSKRRSRTQEKVQSDVEVVDNASGHQPKRQKGGRNTKAALQNHLSSSSSKAPIEYNIDSKGKLIIKSRSDEARKALSQASDSDPALVIDWNVTNLNAAAAAMIGAPAAGGMFAFPGGATPALIQNAIMARLAGFAGGRLGNTILAPNNLQQYGDVMTEASRIEEDAGLAVIPPANLPLAQLYVFQDNRRNTTGAAVTVAGGTAIFA